jgi:hypothetical protein
MSDPIRIANAGGYWGDDLSQFKRQVELGPVDFVTLDFLAEITMSIMQKQRARDPRAGYARDFVSQVEGALPALVERGTRVISNAGGVNPLACRGVLLAMIQTHGQPLDVAAVVGDDLMERLGELNASGVSLDQMDDGSPFAAIRDRVSSANAYYGAWPVVEALRSGAQIVVTGRCTDTGITLAPMIHAFGWAPDDWDRLASGIVAGHVVECGAQSTGGNFTDWHRVRRFETIGYPIVEVSPDGSFVVTKHAGTGGAVTVRTVKEQLVYEMGDPRRYITPDGVADFTTIALTQAGKDRVRVTGVRGGPAPEQLKVSIAYSYGYKAVGTLVYAWPDAVAKARAADRVLRQRLADLGLEFEAILTELIGFDATHGPLSPRDTDPPEVQLRVGVRARDLEPVERFTREIAPLILNGPPSVTGFAGGRPKPEEIVAYWPALIDRKEVHPCVELVRV